MTFFQTIASYRVVFYGKPQSNVARILIYGASNNWLGAVNFYKNGVTLPENRLVDSPSPGKIFISMHEEQLDEVIDTLRYEKPCLAYFYNPTQCYISSGLEPIGEEESQ